jgi:hypothetical protein
MMAARDGWDIVPMYKSGCTPAVLYANYAPNDNLAECHTWYRWAQGTIARLHPDAIFISFLNANSGAIETKDENGMASLLSWGKTVAKHVVLMLDSPLLTGLPQPVDCLQESGATLRTCTGKWGGGPFDSSPSLQAIARQQGVGVIDPRGWFCYRGLCPLVIGHTIAFADYGHVTRTYATALSPPFRAAFRAALRAG